MNRHKKRKDNNNNNKKTKRNGRDRQTERQRQRDRDTEREQFRFHPDLISLSLVLNRSVSGTVLQCVVSNYVCFFALNRSINGIVQARTGPTTRHINTISLV